MANAFFNKNLLLRVVSALVLIPVVLFAVWRGDEIFWLLLGLAGALMAYEWFQMTWRGGSLWVLAGLVYIGVPVWALYSLGAGTDGYLMVFWLFAMVWATDIGAYFSGRIIGGAKLAPSISPGKTWAGAVGGLALAIVVAWWLARFIEGMPNTYWLAGAVVVALATEVGDLAESALKRRFKVKDSGQLIPGHGGILDRVDGLLFAAPVVAIWLEFGHL